MLLLSFVITNAWPKSDQAKLLLVYIIACALSNGLAFAPAAGSADSSGAASSSAAGASSSGRGSASS